MRRLLVSFAALAFLLAACGSFSKPDTPPTTVEQTTTTVCTEPRGCCLADCDTTTSTEASTTTEPATSTTVETPTTVASTSSTLPKST